ncbi:MAG: DUF512 domain-containing protein [Oscillospiraceae bacterium]|nr:DUF512 domain-containing protein [Oscillospiraceae bacterium]
MNVIKSIQPNSPASRTIIAPGDSLRRINGKRIGDVLDYQYHSYESRLLLELTAPDGKMKLVRIKKPEGADIGLEFDTFMMDNAKSCANKCVFCFIDQLPRGMRETLYYKDDDLRLSFLQGNYITLTNLSDHDISRIVELRLSPINVSVHTMDPELRNFILGNKNAGAGIASLRTLVNAGITINCQIVCCPEINDGAALDRTIERLIALGPNINSVSIVPVGLTKHRTGLAELRPFDSERALKTVRQVESFGQGIFFCADELYIKAGLPLPKHEFYRDYPQLENGVGMMRLFITEFEHELAKNPGAAVPGGNFSIATGMLAAEFLTNLLKTAAEKYGIIDSNVYAIRNDFFGEGVTVSGLVTGGDLINQLKGRNLGNRLLIPRNMLRNGEDVFLDDVTVADVVESLGIPIRIVEQDGADFLRAVLGG